MTEYLNVDFSLDEKKFIKEFEEEKLKFKDGVIDFVNIQNISSVQKSFELISEKWFRSQICCLKNLTGINLRISEEINENFNEKPRSFEFSSINKIVITFQSTIGNHASINFWKVPGRDNFYSLFIDDDEDEEITDFFQEFMVDEIKNSRSGILSDYQKRDELLLQDLGTEQNSDLLMMAAFWIRPQIVQEFLARQFDIDYKNNDDDTAIDMVWTRFEDLDGECKKIASEIILSLLKVNSTLPKSFTYENATRDIQEFVDLCEVLHKNVDNNDFDALSSNIDNHKYLIHFYNRDNKSLVLHALENAKFKIIDFLESGICAGPHEELSFMESYKELFEQDLKNLCKIHKINAKELPKTFILILRSKTKIGNNDLLYHTRWKCVEDAYNTLNKNPFCSLLLQVAAQIKSINIFFDFKFKGISYLNPLKAITTLGTTYPNGTIYIAAKGLEFDSTKHIVLATLAHELCHLAILVSYMNPNFDPFPLGESKEKNIFVNEVMTECRERQKEESIVSNAFKYETDVQESELIVTVAEMLMFYQNNPNRIEELHLIFEKLFKYSNDVVMPELKRAIKALNKLADPEINIKYESLTETMRKSFLHFNINLQGANTTFYELFDGHDSCLKLLKPDNIRDILLAGKVLKINQMCTLKLKYSMIERNVMNRNKYQKLKESGIQDYEYKVKRNSKNIFEIRKNSKFFILSDYAGTGKTTFFKDSAIKIKKKETKFWVSYINLRKFDDIFADNEGKSDAEIKQDIYEIFYKIIKNDDKELSNFEKELFKKLFEKGQVILFFDGVDEVCPKHTDTIMNIFNVLKKLETKNEFWISTRPHHAPRIQQIFNVSPIAFVLYTMEQKVEFIKDILIKNGMTDKIEQTNAIGQINAFIFLLNWEPGFFSDPDHPLIIEIITELYSQHKLKLNITSHYELYEAMVDKQKEKVGDKIPSVERDPFRFSVWDVHKALAILVIIGKLYDSTFTYKTPNGEIYKQGFNFILEDLAIIKKWKAEKESGRWTSDMIQRYGFVTVDIKASVEDRRFIEFSHKTYAEFFVAQYLIDFLFNNNFDEAEMIKMMRILEIAQGTPDLVNVCKFIFSYMTTVARKENHKFHPEIKKFLIFRIKETLEDLETSKLDGYSDPFVFFSKIVSFDVELTEKLWGLNSPQNSFDKIILNSENTFIELIIETTIYVFGDNWHERLNRSETKLMTDEQIEAMRDEVVESWHDWLFDKNILKFCDYLLKNFDIATQRKLHEKFINHIHVKNVKVFNKVAKITSYIYDQEIEA